MASKEAAADKYRSFLNDEDAHKTLWRHGGPPSYHHVNQLFEQGRTQVNSPTCMPFLISYPLSLEIVCYSWFEFSYAYLQVWPEGSLEDTVQNAVKSWEMELSNKTRLQDFKTINPEKFNLCVNGSL